MALSEWQQNYYDNAYGNYPGDRETDMGQYYRGLVTLAAGYGGPYAALGAAALSAYIAYARTGNADNPWRYPGTRSQYLRDPYTNQQRANDLSTAASGTVYGTGTYDEGGSYTGANLYGGNLSNLINSYTEQVAPWENVVWYTPPTNLTEARTLAERAQQAHGNIMGDLNLMTGVGNQQQNYNMPDPMGGYGAAGASGTANPNYNPNLPSYENFVNYGNDTGYTDWLVNNYAGQYGNQNIQAPTTQYQAPVGHVSNQAYGGNPYQNMTVQDTYGNQVDNPYWGQNYYGLGNTF